MSKFSKESAKEYLCGDNPQYLTGKVRDRFEPGDEAYVTLQESPIHGGWSVNSVHSETRPAPPDPSKASASIRVTLNQLDDGRWVATDPFCYEFKRRGSM